MIVVALIKWLCGYYRLTVSGRFPERFVNLASRKGINIWELRNEGESLGFFAKRGDMRLIMQTAEKTGNEIHIEKEYGFPKLAGKYKSRGGLLAGAALSAAMCFWMSGFIWNVSLDLPDSINEYEMRKMLRECGICEGVRSSGADTDAIVDHICSTDGRISWMTININGTDAQVRVSERLRREETNGESVRLSNMKSSSDGTVTRVNVYKGTANVRVGDGIRKNQLLVSGIIEYSNGKTVLTDAQANVFAKTHRTVSISIPKKQEQTKKAELVVKRDISIFGLRFPVTMSSGHGGLRSDSIEREQLTVTGHGLPIYVSTEKLQYYEKQPVELKLPQAEEILKNRLSLYEFFMISSTDKGRVLSRKYSVKEEGSAFTLTAEYEIEEDVCRKVVVPMDTE